MSYHGMSMSYSIVWCNIILCHIILYYVILYYVISYYIIYYTISYHTILYYIISYYVILYPIRRSHFSGGQIPFFSAQISTSSRLNLSPLERQMGLNTPAARPNGGTHITWPAGEVSFFFRQWLPTNILVAVVKIARL